MARQEGIEDLGLEAGLELDAGFLAGPLRTRILAAPNLLGGLRQFCNHCSTESSRISAGLILREDTATFWHLGAFDDHSGLYVMEVYFVMVQMAILRLFLGQRWQPPMIGLQGPRVSRRVREHLPETRFLTDQSSHCIRFPRTLLSWPAPKGPALGQGRSNSKVPELPHEFADSLRRLLESYVPDGNPTLDLAAELTGYSRRTLQRRLHEMGLTYSGLLDQVRYGIATRLMSDPSIRLVDVSQSSGYDDPSHFSRAFRRLAGVSPSQYRRTEH